MRGEVEERVSICNPAEFLPIALAWMEQVEGYT